jgi:two-component system response regulator HydG
LRERQSDIPDLVDYVLDVKCRSLDKEKPQLSDDAVDKLQRYFWPGNIRELENLLERMLIFSDRGLITAQDIYFDEDSDTSGEGTGTLSEVLEDTEYRMIKQALKKSGGVKQRAAKLLGIKTSTLYYKMEKYGLFEGAAETENSAMGDSEKE